MLYQSAHIDRSTGQRGYICTKNDTSGRQRILNFAVDRCRHGPTRRVFSIGALGTHDWRFPCVHPLLASRPSPALLLLGIGVAETADLELLQRKVASSWAMLIAAGSRLSASTAPERPPLIAVGFRELGAEQEDLGRIIDPYQNDDKRARSAVG